VEWQNWTADKNTINNINEQSTIPLSNDKRQVLVAGVFLGGA